MSETQNPETTQTEEHSSVCCPICSLAAGVRETKKRHSGFFSHMINAQIEVLQAFKSVLDLQISTLENRRSRMAETKKATKIEVE